MKSRAVLFALLAPALWSVSPSQSAESRDIVAAATKFYPAANWQDASIRRADFTCRGFKDIALLGVSNEYIVVAVFDHGLGQKPHILEYSRKGRKAALAILSVESLDYDPAAMFGKAPEGLERSSTCVGLNLTDELVDSAHIYWNRKRMSFTDWVL